MCEEGFDGQGVFPTYVGEVARARDPYGTPLRFVPRQDSSEEVFSRRYEDIDDLPGLENFDAVLDSARDGVAVAGAERFVEIAAS